MIAKLAAVVGLALAASVGPAVVAAGSDVSADPAGPSTVDEAVKAVNELPPGTNIQDSDAFATLLSMLPFEPDSGFIVEGDIALTRAQVVDWVTSFAEGEPPDPDSAEAKFNLLADRQTLDIYPPGQRILTYSIDKSSFDLQRYDEMRRLMDEATAEWETRCKGCGIDFVHEGQHDEAASTSVVNFVVTFRPSVVGYLADGFYPHQGPDDRVLKIAPRFFTSNYTPGGILRHELGHVLGMRHEHIEGVPGCRREGGWWVNDSDELPPDRKSIMHYRCGGGGGFKMEISSRDATAITEIYTRP
jgi:hypothetical protein